MREVAEPFEREPQTGILRKRLIHVVPVDRSELWHVTDIETDVGDPGAGLREL
jgi:hypothetical protein